MNIVAEIENTISGNIAVVKNEDGSFSVGNLDQSGVFEEKHPNLSNTESVINALSFYLQAEANKRAKLELKAENLNKELKLNFYKNAK